MMTAKLFIMAFWIGFFGDFGIGERIVYHDWSEESMIEEENIVQVIDGVTLVDIDD